MCPRFGAFDRDVLEIHLVPFLPCFWLQVSEKPLSGLQIFSRLWGTKKRGQIAQPFAPLFTVALTSRILLLMDYSQTQNGVAIALSAVLGSGPVYRQSNDRRVRDARHTSPGPMIVGESTCGNSIPAAIAIMGP